MTADRPNQTKGQNRASPDRLRAHYELEKRWAGKLRAALRWFLGRFAVFLRIRHRSRLLGNRPLA
jgi:hypothetical protein